MRTPPSRASSASPWTPEYTCSTISRTSTDGPTWPSTNYLGAQQTLCTLNATADTLEVVGHFNGPGKPALTEPAVNRLPDGTWLAICRQENGDHNYWFCESRDGKTWTTGGEKELREERGRLQADLRQVSTASITSAGRKAPRSTR